MPIINNPKTWMESKKNLGWKVTETIRSWEPNPYGDGEIHLLENLYEDENGNFAGVLVRETFRNDMGKTVVQYDWMPFTLNRSDYSSIG